MKNIKANSIIIALTLFMALPTVASFSGGEPLSFEPVLTEEPSKLKESAFRMWVAKVYRVNGKDQGVIGVNLDPDRFDHIDVRHGFSSQYIYKALLENDPNLPSLDIVKKALGTELNPYEFFVRHCIQSPAINNDGELCRFPVAGGVHPDSSKAQMTVDEAIRLANWLNEGPLIVHSYYE